MTHTNSTQTILPSDVLGWTPGSPRRDLGDLTNLANSISNVGLISPIVIDQNKTLVDGERRLTVFHSRNEPIPYVYRDQLSPTELIELELEANRHRKDFTWQEEVLKGEKLFEQKKRESVLDGETFGQREAGRLLGVSLGMVNRLLTLAKAVRSGDKEILGAETPTAAINVLLRRTQEQAQADLASAMVQNLPGLGTQPSGLTFDLSPPGIVQSLNELEGGSPLDKIEIPLSTMVFNQDARDFLRSIPAESIDHILTDPPYGIDPDNIVSKNIDEIYDSHQVEENKQLLSELIPLYYRVLKPASFCIFCYDLDHHQMLQDLALSVGFKVQRWPLSFCKSSSASNQAAGFNFTKNVEHAMVLRKGNATLAKHQASSFAIFDFRTEQKLYDNPFAKPFELWKWLIEAVSLPGQTILDPCAGGGSSTRAIIQCGRNPIAVEKDPVQFPKLVEGMKTKYLTVTHGKAKFV